MKLNWGWRIAIVYTVFALGTIAMVVFAMTQPVELVRQDYYEYSMKHDDHARALANARALPAPLSVTYDPDHRSLIVHFPPDQCADVHGSIHLYRVSSAALDKTIPMRPGPDGTQIIDMHDAAVGKWTVMCAWTSHGVSYMADHDITAS